MAFPPVLLTTRFLSMSTWKQNTHEETSQFIEKNVLGEEQTGYLKITYLLWTAHRQQRG